MRLLLLIPILVLAPLLAWGQPATEAERAALYQAMGNRARENETRQKISEQVNATPSKQAAGLYLPPYWTRGILKPYSGVASRTWLKYDVLNGQLFFRSATDELVAVNTDALREFSLGDSLLGTYRTYRRYLSARVADPTLRTAFFEVRYDVGGSALLCRRAVYQRYSGSSRQRPTRRPVPEHLAYDERVSYYVRDAKSNSVMPVSPNQASLLAALTPNYQPVLAAYTSRHGLKPDSESDIVRLLAHYDSL